VLQARQAARVFFYGQGISFSAGLEFYDNLSLLAGPAQDCCALPKNPCQLLLAIA
jgi:hypothetical protein